MRLALGEAGISDTDETSVGLKLVDRGGVAVAHCTTDTGHQRVRELHDTALVSDSPFDPFGCTLLEILSVDLGPFTHRSALKRLKTCHAANTLHQPVR